MKPIFYKLSIFAATFAAISCTDLNVDIESQYTKIPNNDRANEAATSDVFFAMRSPLGGSYHQAQSITSDEVIAVAMGTDYYDNGKYLNLELHQVTPDNGYLDYWGTVMGGITKSNIALEGVDETSVTYAQIRTVRAYYYWVLMDSFGDVPLIVGMLDKGEVVDRSPRAKVAEFIESELKEVMDNLPTEMSSANYGLPTKYMAQALLAKLYINWAVYTASSVDNYEPSDSNAKLNDAVKMCDELIASGLFNLDNSYREKFLPENGSHIKDFIYAMPYDHATQRGMSYARFWSHRSMQGEFYGYKIPESLAGVYRMTPAFSNLFEDNGDERCDLVLRGDLYIRDQKTYEPTSTPWLVDGVQVSLDNKIVFDDINTLATGNDTEGRSWGHRSIKFYMDPETTSIDDRSQSNDVPIFRYADILLTKAEAILRGAKATNGDTTLSLMNQIRDYVGAQLYDASDISLDELLNERGREMLDESWRRNDLIRFGKFEDEVFYDETNTLPIKTDKRMRIFPVPLSAMNTNTNWTQNAGY